MKPFTVIAALFLLVIAAAHAARLYFGIAVIVAGWPVPMWISWVATIAPAFLGIMVFAELCCHKRPQG